MFLTNYKDLEEVVCLKSLSEVAQYAHQKAASIVEEAEVLANALKVSVKKEVEKEAHQKLESALEELNHHFQNSLKASSVEITKIILKITKEVVGNELETNKHSLAQRVRKALSRISNEKLLTIQVHPDCIGILEHTFNNSEDAHIKIETNSSLSPIEAHIRLPWGAIKLNPIDHLDEIELELSKPHNAHALVSPLLSGKDF